MEPGFLFSKDVYCLKCNSFGTAVAANDRLPASASFIDMQNFEHGVFLIGIGAEDTAATFSVYQDTSATETGSIKKLPNTTTPAEQLVADNDDNKWLTIEFNANQLDRANSFRYVTISPDQGAGGNDYYCVFFLGFGPRKSPVTQPANYAYAVAKV